MKRVMFFLFVFLMFFDINLTFSEVLEGDVIVNQQGVIVQQFWDESAQQFVVDGGAPVSDYFLDVSKGAVANTSTIFKFGRSVAITSVESVIWDGGGTYDFLDSAEKLIIVSDDTDDTLLGDGARKLVLFGLDSNKDQITEVIEMDGTTPVVSTLDYLRIFRALVLTSGVNDPVADSNEGTITVTTQGTSSLQASVLPREGQTLMCVYTVPNGYTGYVTGLSASAGQGKQILFKGRFRNGPDNSYAFSTKFTIDLYQTSFIGDLKVPLRVPEKTDIVISATTVSGTVNGSASFGIILIKD